MTKLLGVQAMLARVWVSVKEVVVITEVVVIQYSRNLPSRCFASGTSLRSLLSSSTPDNSLLRNIFSVSSQSIYWYKKLPISLNPGTRLAFSSAAVRGWVLNISYYWSTNQRPVSWSGAVNNQGIPQSSLIHLAPYSLLHFWSHPFDIP